MFRRIHHKGKEVVELLSFNQVNILGLLAHMAIILMVLSILRVEHLISNPIVLGAILLSYYDLWINRK